MAVLIDTYATSNRNADYVLGIAGKEGVAQALTITKPSVITSIKFYLKKVGSPNGNLWVRIYNVTGSVGTTAKPTGSVLASSAKVAASTLSTSQALVEFTFATPYLLATGNYCIALEVVDVIDFDAADYPEIGYDSSGEHGGNLSYANTIVGGWTAVAGSDTCFELYGGYPVATQVFIL